MDLCLVGELEDQLVARQAVAAEDRRVGRTEAEGDGAPGLGHRLAGAQVERHVPPPVVVDPRLQRHEGLDVGVLVHVLLVAVAVVLPEHDARRVERTDVGEDRGPRSSYGVGGPLPRVLEGDRAEDLEQVRGDHVAQRAGGLVERAAALHGQRLGDVDLHRGDAAAVPRRLEEGVGEAQRQQVLHGLLAEEVVDAEDLLLLEDLVHVPVELLEGLQVEAEGLLDHQAGPLGQPLAPEHADHPGHRGRRHRQVDEAAHVVTEALLDLPHPGREVRAVVGVGGLERHPVEQVARDVLVEVVDRLAQPLAHLVAEVVVRARRVPPAADDGVVLGQSAGRGEPVEPREQLARREVAAGTEQQEDAGRQGGGRHARHANDHPKEGSGAGGGLSCCCRPPARRRRRPHHSRDWGRARPRSRRTPGPRRRGRPRPARAGRTCRP